MAESRDETIEGQGSRQGENNNHQIKSTLARMADYFERQKGRLGQGDRTATEVSNDVALERFQKFRPSRFIENDGEEMVEK